MAKSWRNSSKSKCFLILARLSGEYLTAKQISDFTGTSYNYLTQRLSYWHTWNYIKRKVFSSGHGRPFFVYGIGKGGQDYLKRIPRESMNRLITEINEWLAKHPVK